MKKKVKSFIVGRALAGMGEVAVGEAPRLLG